MLLEEDILGCLCLNSHPQIRVCTTEIPEEPLSFDAKRAAFLDSAKQLYEKLQDWYDAHPIASYGEIEMEVRKQRRELMGDAIAVLVSGRDTGFQVEAPKCNSCGSGMEFEGYRKWSISGLEVDLQQHSYQAGLWNAAERLWKVAQAAFGEGTPQAQRWAHQHIEQLWHGRARDVVVALDGLNWNQITCLDDVRQSPAYFETRLSKMDYAHSRQEGYPIGSGSVESGVNTVVHHRLKRQGSGWKRQSAQAMLAALSELHSVRFLSAWQSCS